MGPFDLENLLTNLAVVLLAGAALGGLVLAVSEMRLRARRQARFSGSAPAAGPVAS